MIHIYTTDVSRVDRSTYETLYAAASQERRQRADQCRRREAAVCCIAAEALLRYAVKHHCTQTSCDLQYNAYGKPSLKGTEDFHFNLSHSGHWVVLACGSSQVGIDVETIRMDDKLEKMARRHFSAKEQDYVFLEETEREKRFFQMWTAKEGYLKYLGMGLQKPLHSFCVFSMDSPQFFTQWLDDSCVTLCTHEDAYEMKQLRLEQLTETKGE